MMASTKSDPAPACEALFLSHKPTEAEIFVVAETFKLLGDPTRLKILLACLEKPMAVGDIARTVDASQSLVSHHLRLLRAARLVKGTRRSKQVYYEADDHHIRHIVSDMIVHAGESATDHE